MDTVEEKATSLLLTAADIIRSNFNRGSYYNRESQNFCMLGALARTVVPFYNARDLRFSHIVNDEAGFAALLRLSNVIAFHDGCANCTNIRSTDYDNEDAAYYKVSHYNDEHCDGGADAARIFELAANGTENPVIVTSS